MARDTNRFVYVEVALPKDNEAIQSMIAESESQQTPLRVLVKQACIKVYSGEFEERTRSPKSVQPKSIESAEMKVGDSQRNTASSFLDENM